MKTNRCARWPLKNRCKGGSVDWWVCGEVWGVVVVGGRGSSERLD